jgi:hypothetical protein
MALGCGFPTIAQCSEHVLVLCLHDSDEDVSHRWLTKWLIPTTSADMESMYPCKTSSLPSWELTMKPESREITRKRKWRQEREYFVLQDWSIRLRVNLTSKMTGITPVNFTSADSRPHSSGGRELEVGGRTQVRTWSGAGEMVSIDVCCEVHRKLAPGSKGFPSCSIPFQSSPDSPLLSWNQLILCIF